MSGSSSYTKQNHISQMARLNYSYDSRYLLTLTARRDGYSAFGNQSKFGVFPSMAIGWNISNEHFFQASPLAKVVSNLKYRLSWGKNGNEAVGAYTTLPDLSTFNYLKDDHTPNYGFYPSKLASPSLDGKLHNPSIPVSTSNCGTDVSREHSTCTGRRQATYC